MFPPLEDETEEEEEEEPQKLTETLTSQQQSYHINSINSTISITHIPSQGISFQLWPAATTLINLIDHHHHTTTALFDSPNRRLRILELGSGTGVVGIAAAALLKSSVTLTDLPHVIPNLQFNADNNAGVLNLHGGEVDAAALSWGNTREMEAIGGDFDVILGSDLVYHDNLYEPLIETLKFLMCGEIEKKKKSSVVFLMAHVKRWKKESAFFRKAKKFFDVEVVHVDSPSDGCRIGITVYRFVRKNGQ